MLHLHKFRRTKLAACILISFIYGRFRSPVWTFSKMWNLPRRTTSMPSRWVKTRHQSTTTDTLRRPPAGTTTLRCLAVRVPPVRECLRSSSKSSTTTLTEPRRASVRECQLIYWEISTQKTWTTYRRCRLTRAAKLRR